MPGLVAYRRRWLVGSDDLILPAGLLLTFQLFCTVLLSLALYIHDHDTSETSSFVLLYFEISYLVILVASIITEMGICGVSLRGAILDIDARKRIKYYLYIKTVLVVAEVIFLILGVIWLAKFHSTFPNVTVRELILSTVICGWILFLVTVLMIYFTFDGYGRSWVNGNWRNAHYEVKYHRSWEQRCRFWFCCVGSSKREQITDISRIISDFFMEIDVVPSDIAAGFVLLRNFQKLEREEAIRHNPETGIVRFLSGVPVTSHTKYITSEESEILDKAAHYMQFANAAYGWPVYVVANRCGLAKLLPKACCCCCCSDQPESTDISNDNLCGCNYTALRKTLKPLDVDIIYVTYHCDIGETPFFVAVDYSFKKIVISIRGTLSMEDILTDLNGRIDILPLNERREDWMCHRGMLHAAMYIRDKLQELDLIEKALQHDTARKTETFDLVVVGHSLGAGTASILSILLKEVYTNLHCYSFSPPGGLLSLPIVEYTQTFITAVVLGEDVVPRLGLRQLENLRADLIHVLKDSRDPKWKTLSFSMARCCCCCIPHQIPNHNIEEYKEQKVSARLAIDHTLDNERVLSLSHPLYPPGRIIHIGKENPDSNEESYKAIWADTKDYDEVLVSPRMMKDHVPDSVLTALKKVASSTR